MKKIILLILILILLTGCNGIYNLTVFVLPNDIGFMALVEELDTPEKICQYMADNFTYEQHDHLLTPYQLYITRKGDCDDFSEFSIWIANYHGYETYQIKILYLKPIYPMDTWHAITVYKEYNYFTVSENQWYWDWVYFRDFRSIMSVFNGWIKYIVYDYNKNIVGQGYNN